MAEVFNEVILARQKTYARINEPIKDYFGALAEVLSGVGGFDPEEMFARAGAAAGIKLAPWPAQGADWFLGIIRAVELEEAAYVAYSNLVAIVRDVSLFDMLGRSISHTKMRAAAENRDYILATWREYSAARATDNKILINNITAAIVAQAKDEAINYVTTRPLNSITIMIVRRLLNSGLPESQQKLLRVAVDAGLRGLFSKDPLRHVSFLSRHGLVPATPSLPWEEVTAGLDVMSRVVITYSTGSGLEFDIRGLIDADYIAEHNLETVDGCGLNKKVIARFITTKALKSPRQPWNIEVVGDGPYYVFESIAEGLFRLMRRATDAQASKISARSIIEGISPRAEEYHREIGLTTPFDRAHRYIMLDIAAREPYTPSGELYEFINRMQESVTTTNNFRETMIEEATRVFIQTFKHTTLAAFGAESMVSYLLRVEPLIDILKERLGAAITRLDLKQLRPDRVRDVVGELSRAVIESMIEDKSLVDYDNTFKLVYLQKRQAGYA